MCIFSQPVESVDNTKLFVRATETGTQFLVYQMSYSSAHPNAMILPLPIRRPTSETSLRFIDLSHYERFFGDLSDGFPFIAPLSIGCSGSESLSVASELEVFEVGNYIGSFVPSLADFSRLDERFTLPNSAWEKIPQYDDYGFAVFQLAEGSLQPHPMAFEYETRSDRLFFPTLHIHDGEVHSVEEFDHTLYLQHAGFDSRVYGYENSDVLDKATGLIRSKHVASQFCNIEDAKEIVSGDLLVHRMFVAGNQANRDIEVATVGHPTVVGFNFRSWLVFWPWLIFLAAVSWFFMRRHRLKQRTTVADGSSSSLPPES